MPGRSNRSELSTSSTVSYVTTPVDVELDDEDEDDDEDLVLLEAKCTCVIFAANVRLGNASTVNVASWPTSTAPTSASSTATCSSIFLRSSASVNSTGACSEAATVWPGSTERTSTTPSIGERISALLRSVL